MGREDEEPDRGKHAAVQVCERQEAALAHEAALKTEGQPRLTER